MKIRNINDVEKLIALTSLPTIEVNNEGMATNIVSSFFIQRSRMWNKEIIPHICQRVSLTFIARSIDGYNAGENNKRQLKKEVFTYGIIDIKDKTSLLICIEITDYSSENFDQAFPVLLENIISFSIQEDHMKYAK